MSLKEGILDALIDDDETIVQIEEYLQYLGIYSDRKIIKNTLIEYLNESIIKITYPRNITQKIEHLDDEKLEELWFQLTPKGKLEWEKIY